MKYRRLSQEELEPLHEEFLKYLLVANVTPTQWEELKLTDANACEKHIEVFSDLIFEKILQDIQFVDRILPKRVECYQFLKEYALMYAIEAKNKGFNFQEQELDSLVLNDFHFIEGKKKYVKDKTVEVFDVLQQTNAKISQGELFKQLALKLAETKS